MSLRVLNWVLTAFIWLTGITAVLILGFSILAAIGVKPVTLSVPVILESAESMDVLLREEQVVVGKLVANKGTLQVTLDRWQPLVPLTTFVILTVGIGLCIAIILRSLIKDIASGNPFSPKSESRLRLIGWLLISCNIIVICVGFVLPVSISDMMVEDGRILVDSLSIFGLPAKPHMKVTVSLGGLSGFWMAACGLIPLALAEAFRIGRNLQVDGEGII